MIISLVQKLFYKFRSALSHCHGTECTITGVAVRTKDHLAAACEHFTGKLVDNGLMRRNIDTAVLLRTGQSKHVVIFIDRTADCTQRVMAVGQNIWHRELLKS